MRKLVLIVFSLLIIINISSCKISSGVLVKRHPHGMPPGQAKKVYGSKSAKHFAPGRIKKRH